MWNWRYTLKACANNSRRYDRATRALHWTQAALILGLIALGWWMVGLTYYDRWYNDSLFWHRALGMLSLLLAALQLVWRWVRAPAESSVSGWEKIAATWTHRALLTLMLATPITGYLISTSAGDGIPLPGGMEIPALLSVSTALRDAAVTAHYYFAYAIAAIVAVHSSAAVKHHIIDRNDVLRRML